MKAVQLQGFHGFEDLKLVEIARPQPGPDEVLIEVKAAGLNWAEVEQTRGRYPSKTLPPYVMGFEAAGVIAELGANVVGFRHGDRVAALTTSGGFAEFATASAQNLIAIPPTLSFADATTLPVQGVSAYALLQVAARPQPGEILLVQSAAGGVGLYLVQLAKHRGVQRVVALVGSSDKADAVRRVGADVVVDSSQPDWSERVREATDGRGVDVVLEMSSGQVQEESLKLLAPFGRMVFFGAQNMYDTISPERMRRLIANNQSLIYFNLPSLQPEQVRASLAGLLELVVQGKLEIRARQTFPLSEAPRAFEALASRRTIGKVVLVP